MKYLPIQFTSGLTGTGYQEIAEEIVSQKLQTVIRIVDEGGNTIEIPEHCEYYVTSPDFVTPEF